MPARHAIGDFRLDYNGVGSGLPDAAPPSMATGCGCSVTGCDVPWGGGAGQQLQAQGGQVSPAAQAGQAQAHPPPEPASTGGAAFAWAHDPVGHGVVMHSMLSEVQPHASTMSAVQEVTSVWAVQGSAGGVARQPHGAHAAPIGQAGQPQTAPGADPELPELPELLTDPDALPVPEEGAVVVVVAPLLHEQLHAGQASPAGHAGQLQVQVPDPPPAPVAPPLPVAPPEPVLLPVVLPQPPDWPQAQSQGGQTSPGRQAGQSQVQAPPPPAPPPSATGGGGQSHCTGGQLPLAGQASGCTQRQLLPDGPRSRQKPPPSQV